VTIYCYDTEFVDDGSSIELISIGIVCEDGREYYAVNSDVDFERVKSDDWLWDHVVSRLPVVHPSNRRLAGLDLTNSQVRPRWVIANEVRDFLLAEGEAELWAHHAAYDHVVLCQLLAGRMVDLPAGIPHFTHELQQAIEDHRAPVRAPDDDHHALDDARNCLEVLRVIRGGRDRHYCIRCGGPQPVGHRCLRDESEGRR